MGASQGWAPELYGEMPSSFGTPYFAAYQQTLDCQTRNLRLALAETLMRLLPWWARLWRRVTCRHDWHPVGFADWRCVRCAKWR